MTEMCRKRFDALVEYLDQIHSKQALEQASVLIYRFIDKCDVEKIYKVFLEFKLWNLEKRINCRL